MQSGVPDLEEAKEAGRRQGFRLFQALAAKAKLSSELHPPTRSKAFNPSALGRFRDQPALYPPASRPRGPETNTMRYLEIHDWQASQVTATALAAVYV